MDLPSVFTDFPAHRKIAEKVLRLLEQDERVLGVYLSGSFASGRPDEYSDLDFGILVPAEAREQILQEHAKLRAQVGDILADFPATHLGDPNLLITFYREDYPVHVDFQYRIKEELTPRARDRNVAVLLDRSGALEEWKAACGDAVESDAPTPEQLQYFEDRLWAWCIYTDSKIKRGELWEAREAIEYIRNNVLVRVAYYLRSLPFEGNRRIDTKFPRETTSLLESTLPAGHSQKEYSDALFALANAYVQLMDETTRRFGVRIQTKDRGYFIRLLRDQAGRT
jgi:predicted nucleotidyltransferase